MDTGLFISLLNPAIALTLACAFLMLWVYQRERTYLATIVLAYIGSAAGFLLQYFVLPIGLEATKLLSNLCFVGAALCLASAVISRYGRPVPWVALAVCGLGGLAGFTWFMFISPDLDWRVLSMNFAFAGVTLIVAAELRPLLHKGMVERILFALSVLSAANFIARTLLVITWFGPHPHYEGFYNSVYWTTALLSHAVLSLLIALSLFTAEALDILKTLRSESFTDPLSGLLNRRGFETKAAALLDMCMPSRLPVSLIVADLDRFKALNDRHGHAAGDRVIAEFAAHLKSAAGTRAIAGRLGGEEFAVLVPMADPAAARLLAEAVRAVFSAGPIVGLHPQTRVTASFGIATRSGGESLATLSARADDALYHAKRSGRDGIRVSYQRPPEGRSEQLLPKSA